MALTVVHFTDEINMVEISTFRNEISILVPAGYRAMISSDGALVTMIKEEA